MHAEMLKPYNIWNFLQDNMGGSGKWMGQDQPRVDN